MSTAWVRELGLAIRWSWFQSERVCRLVNRGGGFLFYFRMVVALEKKCWACGRAFTTFESVTLCLECYRAEELGKEDLDE